jgi:hypothetical protein
MGQMEMKCIFDIGKNISTWAKVTQVSDVAHGPLVLQLLLFKPYKHLDTKQKNKEIANCDYVKLIRYQL